MQTGAQVLRQQAQAQHNARMKAYNERKPIRKEAARDLKSNLKELEALKVTGRRLSVTIDKIEKGTPTLDQIAQATTTRKVYELAEDRVRGLAAMEVLAEVQQALQKRRSSLAQSVQTNEQRIAEQPPAEPRGLSKKTFAPNS